MTTTLVSAPPFDEPPQPFPKHASLGVQPKGGVAPLKIVTNPHGYYFIKLVDSHGVTRLTAYIVGGQTALFKVPLGSYRLRYAFGTTWYGQQHLFGPETAYSEADSTFDFSQDAQGYSGYTVELILQPGGNLHERKLSASEF